MYFTYFVLLILYFSDFFVCECVTSRVCSLRDEHKMRYFTHILKNIYLNENTILPVKNT